MKFDTDEFMRHSWALLPRGHNPDVEIYKCAVCGAIFKSQLDIDSVYGAHATQGEWDGNCDLAVVIKVTES